MTRRWLIDPKHSCRRLFTRSGPFTTHADRLRPCLRGGRFPVAGPAARSLSPPPVTKPYRRSAPSPLRVGPAGDGRGRPGVYASVFAATCARNRPGNGPRRLAKSECAKGQIISVFRTTSARVSCEVTRAGLTWARSTFRTDARRSVSCDTSTTPETPGSWGAAEIGRGRR